MLRIQQNKLIVQANRCILGCKSYSSSGKKGDDDNESQFENPITRTTRILGNDMKRVKNWVTDTFRFSDARKKPYEVPIKQIDYFIQNRERQTLFQHHCDVLVIGGGAIGSSAAYWLKQKGADGINVVVVERDPTYKEASTPLSVGGLRHQFSLMENIQMSLYGSDFIRDIKYHLGDDIDVSFTPYGYLMLATEEGAEQLKRNSRLQNELGARNEILSARRLKEKFPYLNTDGIALGCHGLEREGWFDPWALLCGLKRKAIQLGAHYVNGEVTGFNFRDQPDITTFGVDSSTYQTPESVNVKLPNGETQQIAFGLVVIAGGAHSANIAEMAKIGKGEGLLSIPLPIEPRKRYVYTFGCDEKPELGATLNTPLVIDPSGVYFRREGLSGLYIGGRSPECVEKEPPIDNLDVDYDYFDTDVWPLLAQRVPKFEGIKVKSGWAGYYEYNTFDENGIIGPHSYYHNLYIASGFSGHGKTHLYRI
jgi:FAD-dependent oxidoreductase domain-containing protein 1